MSGRKTKSCTKIDDSLVNIIIEHECEVGIKNIHPSDNCLAPRGLSSNDSDPEPSDKYRMFFLLTINYVFLYLQRLPEVPEYTEM